MKRKNLKRSAILGVLMSLAILDSALATTTIKHMSDKTR